MTLSESIPVQQRTLGLDREERSGLEAATAGLMEQLSKAETAPEGFVVSAVPLSSMDIGWDDGTWASCLADIEGWLRFDAELPFHSRDLQARMLAREMGFKDPSAAFAGALSDLRLTDQGLAQLHSLLERATKHQSAFLEAESVEQEVTTPAETAWEEAWEDDEVEIEPSSGPVAAKAAVWPINEFSNRALRGKLNLSPSYQRADVWPTADAQLLIESILRGIPLPSVIILKPQRDASAPYEVVDGKQRLTSILRFMGAHPLAVQRIRKLERDKKLELLPLFAHDYPRFKSAWKSATDETLTMALEKEYYFPFRLSTSETSLNNGLEHLRGRYYTQIRTEVIEVAEERIEVGDLFERVTEYKIPVIEYFRATHRQIHEVFNLYNKQGKHLNAEEIRNALFHDIDLMRGLLVASGDNKDLEGVAPFLSPRWAAIEPISQTLTKLGVGNLRYHRTKLLSWVAALLVDDSRDEMTGNPKRLSTARQIDSFLARVQNDEHDELREGRVLQDLFGLVGQSISLLGREADAWAPRFKNVSGGALWQDLPLVGTLIGLAAARAVLGDRTDDRVRACAAEIRRATAEDPLWERPSKTQTATQWAFIATVALNTLRLLGIDPNEASATLSWQFGQSGIQALLQLETKAR